MGRKKREVLDDTSYHVASKINHGELLFQDAAVRALFVDIVKSAAKKFGFTIKTYCIMGNHFHFVMHVTHKGPLPDVMRWIKTMFAKKYNRHTGQKGIVWGSRYFSKPIFGVGHYLTVFCYIARNPVSAGLCENIADYKFSALFEFIHQKHNLAIPPGDLEKLFMELILGFRI